MKIIWITIRIFVCPLYAIGAILLSGSYDEFKGDMREYIFGSRYS